MEHAASPLHSPSFLWDRFPALRSAPYRAYLAGLSVSVVGSWMQAAAQGWYVQTLTRDVGSEYWLGLTATMQSLPILLFALHGGLAADRWSKRTVVLITQILAASAALSFGVLLAFGWASLPVVLILACVLGATMAFDIPARQAFAVELVGRTALPSAIGLNSLVFNLGRLLGPLAAGAVMATLGLAACFLLNGLSFVGVIVALWMMKPPQPPQRGLISGRRSEIFGGLDAVRRRPQLLGLLSLLGAVQLTGGAYVALLPALAQNVLELNSYGYTALLLANGVGALIGSFWVATLTGLEARRRSIVFGVALMAAGLLGLSFCRVQGPAMVCLLAVGAGFVVFLTGSNSTIQLSVPDEVRGRVMSLWVLMFGATQPLGSYLAGATAGWGGTPGILFRAGLGCLASAAGAAWILRLPVAPELDADLNQSR